ncbi:MAG: hypothetical protein ACPG46_01750 [Thalassotalea sp.]
MNENNSATKFIITCHGWSASNWLSYALSQHEDIIASHSAANLYEEKLTNNIKGKIQEFHKGYVNRQSQSIAKCYSKITSYGHAKLYGSVHLYRLRDIPVLYKKFGNETETYTTLNLIRDPIKLIWSGYGQFKELFRTDINELHWTLSKIMEDKEEIDNILSKYEIFPGDFINLAFIGAACILGSLRKDLDALTQVKEIPFINYCGHIKMEDVTQHPDTLRKLITLANDEIEVTDAYLEKVYSLGPINEHNKNAPLQSSKELFNSLSLWQQEITRFYMNKYKITDSYQSLGYDLSFLN